MRIINLFDVMEEILIKSLGPSTNKIHLKIIKRLLYCKLVDIIENIWKKMLFIKFLIHHE